MGLCRRIFRFVQARIWICAGVNLNLCRAYLDLFRCVFGFVQAHIGICADMYLDLCRRVFVPEIHGESD